MNNNNTSKRKIIGIMGKKYHGKDTIADIIVDKYNYQKISFAHPLKEGCRHIFGLTDDQLYGEKKEVIDDFWRVTPRKILQIVGTELFRDQLSKYIPDIKNTIWVKSLERTFLDNPNTNYVVSDIRFQNELDMIKKYNGIIIKVYRPNLNNEDEHISEKESDKITGFDFEILNDSTIDSLSKKNN